MSDQGAGNIPVTGVEHVLLQNDEGAWIGEATTQQIADLGSGGGGSTITVSDTDPGATGAGSGWLLTDAAGVPLAFFIRNNADDGWLSDGALPAGALESTVEIADDLEVGEASGTFARMQVFPLAIDGGYVTAWQGKFEGDAYPRVIIVSDGTYAMGDGTFNPISPIVTGFVRTAAGMAYVGGSFRLGLENGQATLKGPNATGPAVVAITDTSALDFGQQSSDPAAPASNTVRLFAHNNGASVVELAVEDQDAEVTPLLRLFPTLPPDGDIPNSGLAFALDDTPGATKLLVKAKDSGGTVRTGALNLT